MDPIFLIITIAILIMSVVLHELAHGYVAELLGDPTPRLQGRLTVNPIRHLELFGSVIVPLITSLLGVTFGWAKPVEWNPYNIKNRRVGELLISIAGPLANILIAIVFGVIIRYLDGDLSLPFAAISAYIVIINITLAIFNLIPIPPLDGSKILFSLIPSRYSEVRHNFERHSLVLVLLLVLVLWRFVEPVIPWAFTILTGANLF